MSRSLQVEGRGFYFESGDAVFAVLFIGYLLRYNSSQQEKVFEIGCFLCYYKYGMFFNIKGTRKRACQIKCVVKGLRSNRVSLRDKHHL